MDDAEKSIEIIFLQVTAIENTSELIILDGTYKINNAMIMEDNTVPIHDWMRFLASSFKSITSIKNYHQFKINSTDQLMVKESKKNLL